MASITDQNWVVWNQGKNPLVNFNFMLRVELMFDLPCKSVRAFTRELEYDYIQEHLRILSGFYGLLRPFDGVRPYRLEMQAKLAVAGHKDLYSFWGSTLAEALEQETDTIIDLASKEYSKAVSAHLSPSTRLIGCIFAQQAGDKLAEKGTLCKMARGEMVRFLAEQQADRPEALKSFDRLGFRFSPEHSQEDKYVFIKE